MAHRIVWPITVVVVAIILAVGISNIPAQTRPARPAVIPPQPGRFTVAGTSKDFGGGGTYLLVLDTATGKIYRVEDGNWLTAKDLARVGAPVASPDKDSKTSEKKK